MEIIQMDPLKATDVFQYDIIERDKEAKALLGKDKGSKKLSKKAAIGIVVGAIVLITATILIVKKK